MYVLASLCGQRSEQLPHAVTNVNTSHDIETHLNDFSPLDWLLGRTERQEPGLREIERARNLESHEYIVERVLARLIQIEAHERKEYNPSLTVDTRVAWLTVKLASEGNPEPFRQATRDILHCEPEQVWTNIVNNRKLKLGADYYKWYSSVDDSQRLDIPDIKRSTSGQPLDPTGAGVTERGSPAPVPSREREKLA